MGWGHSRPPGQPASGRHDLGKEDDQLRFSRAFIPTLREVPADAEFISHKLLLRAGFIRKLASGIYEWLPLGHRVVEKVADIVREENNAAGGQELLLPALHPKELWDETGRSAVDVIFRLKDRGDREMLLGMTHEEVITDLVRDEIRSYRQLPLMLYQIQTKFRDEPRPRGGVIRGREFLMHDCYSFHSSQESLDETYRRMYVCYSRILKRLNLGFLPVEAESGAIGGSVSHEFMVLVDSGEDTVLICDSCGYAANAERCEIGDLPQTDAPEPAPLKLVQTPGKHTIEEVTEFLGIPAETLIKTLVYRTEDGETVVGLIRGDCEMNEAKLSRALGGRKVELADAETIQKVTGAPVGFAGPQGLNGVRIVAGQELKYGGNWVTGANQADAHVVNVNLDRDFKVSQWADLRVAVDGDPCPYCQGTLKARHGIEAGHIFKLGTKYSASMGAGYLDQDGKEQTIIMGTYGMGVTRAVAAMAEQCADADGLLWPASVAPYDVVLLCLNVDEDAAIADGIYEELKKRGLDVLYDDRHERAGVKFKDADLIGVPVQIVVGRGAKDGRIELRVRGRGEKREVPVAEAAAGAQALHEALLKELDAAADAVCPPAV